MYFKEQLIKLAESNLLRYSNFKVMGIAVFAQQENGLYSLYLPKRIGKGKYVLNEELQCVCANIEEFRKSGNNYIGDGGYTLNDESDNILGIYIAANCRELHYQYSYKVLFNKPVKKIKFIKRIIKENTNKDKFPELAIDLWGITYINGKKEIVVQTVGNQFKLLQYQFNYSDIVF